ncbi:hypothetical protein AWC33_13870 [Lacticaseibacillus paracasei]|uniref:Uncharacterized protein n=4 Tax=Lacticaseibacillus paracasei TaxID=1597 RepID=A0A8E0M9T4_LACPA|nr:hypothetical protein AWC33_13870 [Lacticaseibacillus paracasei]EPC51829.1 hypothetical protein Lpp7_08236 [Lacticaseibacillus paracasei subsp. paracasei Lpp7]MCT3336100.1 hypothetical protein [Lacticaseibacillus paracasei]
MASYSNHNYFFNGTFFNAECFWHFSSINLWSCMKTVLMYLFIVSEIKNRIKRTSALKILFHQINLIVERLPLN